MTDREVKFVGTTEFTLLKERIDRAEGSEKGKERMADTRTASNSNILALAALVATIVGAVVGAILHFMTK